MTAPNDNTPSSSTPSNSLPSDAPPDRLSNDPRSKYHDEALLERGIGIRFNGEERHNVEEYCVSEGWIRVQAGRALDRRGQPMTIKIRGKVEPWFRT
jgi:hypothetical protein